MNSNLKGLKKFKLKGENVMKKTKFLALVLVASIMLMGAGYAYWTDTLTIENTVATGNLDVTFTDLNVLTYDNYDIDPKELTDDTYMKADIHIVNEENGDENDMLKIAAPQLFPDCAVKVSSTIKNNSTIPINFYAIDYTVDGETIDYLDISVKIGDNVYQLSDLSSSDTIDVDLPIDVNENPDVEVIIHLDKDAPNTTQNSGELVFTLIPKFKQFNDNTK